jgi:2-dehydropantoate 2-reductase
VRPIAPGEVNQQGPAGLSVADDALGREFKALFEGTRVSVTLSPDLVTDAWHKLCQNAVNGAMCALTLQPISVLRNPAIAELAKAMIKEVIAVGRAEGAKLDDALAEKIVAQFKAIPGAEHHGNSMYYDRMAGRPTEIEARNEVVVRLGAKHRIATPINSAMCALLRAVDGQPVTSA